MHSDLGSVWFAQLGILCEVHFLPKYRAEDELEAHDVKAFVDIGQCFVVAKVRPNDNYILLVRFLGFPLADLNDIQCQL